MKNELINAYNLTPIKKGIDIYYNFILGAFVEIKGNESSGPYLVKFIDRDSEEIIYQQNIMNNCWAKASRQWFTRWRIQIELGGKKINQFDLDLKKKRVFIAVESNSLGDTLAWFPYIEEFRKKHDCYIFCSTFWNFLFKKEYKDIEFINPGNSVKNIYAQYNIGLFSPPDKNKNPLNTKLLPLQKLSSSILGIDYTEIKPKITIPDKPRKIKDKYVCIGIHSTAQCKYWNYPNGWQKVVTYLNSIGYKVVHISKEQGKYMGNNPPLNIIDKTGDIPIEDRIIDLKYADMFIGISSGLSWLSWAVGTPSILISGFTNPWHEPNSNIFRIFNGEVCSGCIHDDTFEFDKGNWVWCPRNKDFECSKSITPDMVIEQIDKIISLQKRTSQQIIKNVENIMTFDNMEIMYSDVNTFNILKSTVYQNKEYEKYFIVKNGDVVVDIGSHIGFFLLSLKDRKIKKYYGIEPDKLNFECLSYNIKNVKNNIDCVLIEKAIDLKTGYDYFLKDNVMGIYGKTNEGIKIETISFDDFINQNKITHIDFLKIDCEGGEYFVFQDKNLEFIKKNVDKIAGEIHLLKNGLRNEERGKEALNLIHNLEINGFNVILNSLDGVDITNSFKDRVDYYTEILFYAEKKDVK